MEVVKKIMKVISKIFIIITSPLWYPWKLLFFRKEGKKFKDVSVSIKVFRILKSFITIPLKFILFMMVVAVEVLLLYKVRFSVVTYPITRAFVHNYYLKDTTFARSILGIDTVFAVDDYGPHKEELKKAFEYIDNWGLDEKNKMYVLLDARITKIGFRLINDDTISDVINRFNTEESFREDIKFAAKNVNSILQRGIKQFPEQVNIQELNTVLSPILTISSYTIDYREVLDVLGTIANFMLNDSSYEANKENNSFTKEEIYDALDMVIYFAKGKSIKEAYDIINARYLAREDSYE